MHTLAIPVSSNPQDVVLSADVDAVAALLAKQAGEIAVKTGLDQARARIHQACVDMLRDPRGATGPYSPAPQLTAPPQSLQLLPLYAVRANYQVFHGSLFLSSVDVIAKEPCVQRWWRRSG